jgi:transcriptional regulator with XRE-family HTH domain
MGSAQLSELSEAQSREMATVIREQLARRRMSRQRLADEAKISISTLEKALNGNRSFTLATIIRLEQVLGITLRSARPMDEDTERAKKTAPAELGAYSREAVRWLEGNYLTLRSSFEVNDAIYAYCTNIYWDDSAGCMAFREAERLDAAFAQKGVVSIPVSSGHIYLYTNEQGQMRLAILGRPLKTGEMFGLLTTLLSGSGPQLLPLATPFALIPLPHEATFGRVTKGQTSYQSYHGHLSRIIDKDFCRLRTL